MNFSNVKKIINHEWKTVFRQRIVPTVVGILAFTLFTALFVGLQNYNTYETEREKHQQSVADKWVNQPDRHPHRVAHYGYIIFRPKSALSFFDSGVESFAGNSIFLEAHKQNSANFSEARHSSGILRFGELTPGNDTAIACSFVDIFLRICINYRRTRKWNFADAFVAKCFVARDFVWQNFEHYFNNFRTSFADCSCRTFILVRFEQWRSFFRFVYKNSISILDLRTIFAICAGVSVLVSAFCKTSRSSLLVLVVIWILFFIVMPRAVQNLGAIIYETPSQSEFEKNIERDISKEGDSHNANDPKFAEIKKETLKKYNVSDVKDLPFNYRGYISLVAEEISSKIFQEHYGEVLEQFSLQNRFAEISGLINPYLAVRQLSMATAGSGFANYENFQWQAEEYRFEIIQKLNKLYVEEIKAEKDRDQKIDSKVWKEFPVFKNKSVSFGESLKNQLLSIIANIAWLGLVFAGLWFYEPEKCLKMNLKTITKLELKNFLSGRSVLAVFLCIGLAVAYAVYQGGSVAQNKVKSLRKLRKCKLIIQIKCLKFMQAKI